VRVSVGFHAEIDERTIRRMSAAPLCPTCGQPASKALGGPEHDWECRNEACPEFGQPLGDHEPERAADRPGSQEARRGPRRHE